jgi:2,3-bisphosphoglycerate-independent phosphoglycerate mutase
MDHFYALLEMAKDQAVSKIFLHLFTDGRDSSQDACLRIINKIREKINPFPNIKIATISGRSFAMDRNNNWNLIQKAYNAMVNGEGEKINDPAKYLQESYDKKVFDEYINPAVLIDKKNNPIGKVSDNDSLIFFNFREDRAREITQAFVLPGFMKFKRTFLNNLYFVAMTQYEEGLPINIAYAPIEITNTLGELIDKQNLFQLRIAETEKFAHVTYFFNAGLETAYSKEDRIIVPSPIIDRFDKIPEMSADKITEKVLNALELKKYNFIAINYANADMVGHTGNEKATIKAVEKVDECLSRLFPAVLSAGGCLLITADHGNAEQMKNILTGEIDTEHTNNPVPCWFITNENHFASPKNSLNKNGQGETNTVGIISDIAPTILDLLGIPIPKEMTGESLLPLLK